MRAQTSSFLHWMIVFIISIIIALYFFNALFDVGLFGGASESQLAFNGLDSQIRTALRDMAEDNLGSVETQVPVVFPEESMLLVRTDDDKQRLCVFDTDEGKIVQCQRYGDREIEVSQDVVKGTGGVRSYTIEVDDQKVKIGE